MDEEHCPERKLASNELMKTSGTVCAALCNNTNEAFAHLGTMVANTDTSQQERS